METRGASEGHEVANVYCGSDQQHVEREVVFEMTVEGCLSPDVYPPQFTGANLLKRVGRDTW